MTAGSRIADYLDAIQYRRYCPSLVMERRRLLAYAALCGDDHWLRTAPMDAVLGAVRARCQIRSRSTMQKVEAAVMDYRLWRRREEAGDGD